MLSASSPSEPGFNSIGCSTAATAEHPRPPRTTTREGLEEIMALLVTPRPGFRVRVACTDCPQSTVLVTRLSPVAVRAIVQRTELEHVCTPALVG